MATTPATNTTGAQKGTRAGPNPKEILAALQVTIDTFSKPNQLSRPVNCLSLPQACSLLKRYCQVARPAINRMFGEYPGIPTPIPGTTAKAGSALQYLSEAADFLDQLLKLGGIGQHNFLQAELLLSKIEWRIQWMRAILPSAAPTPTSSPSSATRAATPKPTG